MDNIKLDNGMHGAIGEPQIPRGSFLRLSTIPETSTSPITTHNHLVPLNVPWSPPSSPPLRYSDVEAPKPKRKRFTPQDVLSKGMPNVKEWAEGTDRADHPTRPITISPISISQESAAPSHDRLQFASPSPFSVELPRTEPPPLEWSWSDIFHTPHTPRPSRVFDRFGRYAPQSSEVRWNYKLVPRNELLFPTVTELLLINNELQSLFVQMPLGEFINLHGLYLAIKTEMLAWLCSIPFSRGQVSARRSKARSVLTISIEPRKCTHSSGRRDLRFRLAPAMGLSYPGSQGPVARRKEVSHHDRNGAQRIPVFG